MAEDDVKIKGLRFAKVIVWLVYAYFIVAVIILVAAFFLLLFNASTDAEFTRWVYRSSDRVLEPFRGIFPTVQRSNGSVIDFAILFAIIMYGIFALLVHSLVYWIDGKVVQQRRELETAEQQARYEVNSTAPQPGAVVEPGPAQALPSTGDTRPPTTTQRPAPRPPAAD